MFTGIIEETGKIISMKRGANSCVLTVGASRVLEDVHVGDSIATNGVCLTVTSFTSAAFSADVMHETLRRSSLGELRQGSLVNLERAMPMNGRFGGHIVSGHIDGTGIIADISADDNAVWYTIKAPGELLRYIVEKGSVALDGISLTVAAVNEQAFKVSVIPHTRAVTNLAQKHVGSVINIETDVIGKYVERLVEPYGHNDMSGHALASAGFYGHKPAASVQPPRALSDVTSSGITKDFLAANGF